MSTNLHFTKRAVEFMKTYGEYEDYTNNDWTKDFLIRVESNMEALAQRSETLPRFMSNIKVENLLIDFFLEKKSEDTPILQKTIRIMLGEIINKSFGTKFLVVFLNWYAFIYEIKNKSFTFSDINEKIFQNAVEKDVSGLSNVGDYDYGKLGEIIKKMTSGKAPENIDSYLEKLTKAKPITDSSNKKARELFGGLMD